jgi:hypothetical protein
MYHGVTQEPRSPAKTLAIDEPNEPADGHGPAEERGEGARKERVLHTRIPAVLEQELKRFAENLRVPVSNLVRTILEDALAVADRASGRVEAELHAVAQAASDTRDSLRTKLRPRSILDDVFGFQPIVLAQETLCTACGVPLESGASAWLGLRELPGPRVIACAECLPTKPPRDG